MEKITEENYLKALGAKIKSLREAADMSREDLAEQIGTTRMQIHRIESGILKNNPTILILLRISRVFNTPINKLVTIN